MSYADAKIRVLRAAYNDCMVDFNWFALIDQHDNF